MKKKIKIKIRKNGGTTLPPDTYNLPLPPDTY